MKVIAPGINVDAPNTTGHAWSINSDTRNITAGTQSINADARKHVAGLRRFIAGTRKSEGGAVGINVDALNCADGTVSFTFHVNNFALVLCGRES
jgi:hypothetical protein